MTSAFDHDPSNIGPRGFTVLDQRLGTARTKLAFQNHQVSTDPADAAIIAKLESDRGQAVQGLSNILNAEPLANAADGALSEIQTLTARLTEYASVASVSTLSSARRDALQDEATAIATRIAEIGESTEFNGDQIFTGSYAPQRIVIGPTATSTTSYQTVTLTDLELGGGSYDVITTTASGDFTFNTGVTSTIAVAPYDYTMGDINGDGKADLVVAASGPAILSYLGNGNGTFALNQSIDASAGAGLTAYDPVLADLDGDTDLDLIYANSDEDRIYIRLNNGFGTFGTALSMAGGNGADQITVGDFNGDGKKDIAVSSDIENTVSILKGNGNGTFLARVSYVVTDPLTLQNGGDLNEDGYDDLIISRYNSGTNTTIVRISEGSATTMVAGATYSGLSGRYDNIQVGYIDNDTDIDFMLSDHTGASANRTYIGNGDGNFAAGTTYSGATGGGAALGDVDADGKLDMVTNSNFGGVGRINYFEGDGSGTYGAPTTYVADADAGADNLLRPTIADIDGDGVKDIFTYDSTSNYTSFLKGVRPSSSSTTTTYTFDGFDLSTAESSAASYESALDLLSDVSGKLSFADGQRGNLTASYAEVTARIDVIDHNLRERVQQGASSNETTVNKLEAAAPIARQAYGEALRQQFASSDLVERIVSSLKKFTV